MNSIIPKFNYSYTNIDQKPGNTLYHHHKLEIINQKDSASCNQQPLSLSDKIKNIIADILIFLGSILAMTAGTALTLQTAGISSPVITVLANLLLPAITAILTGSHLTKNETKKGASLRLQTGLPGLTFSA